jgi:hypothetical protein
MTDRSAVIDRVVAAYRALGALAETVEAEWQYVTDLVDAYAAALEALRVGPPLPLESVVALDEAIEEIGLIVDPHKAIDWLSTFPHLVGLAVGGDVDSPGAGRPEPVEDTPPEPDDDNPFRALLGRGR